MRPDIFETSDPKLVKMSVLTADTVSTKRMTSNISMVVIISSQIICNCTIDTMKLAIKLIKNIDSTHTYMLPVDACQHDKTEIWWDRNVKMVPPASQVPEASYYYLG